VRPLLGTSGQLMTAARIKARDIVTCGEFSHTACGRPFAYWMAKSGYAQGCYGAGENIAWGSGSRGTVRETMRGWLNSSGHRANVLKPSFRDHGVGLVQGTFQGYGDAQLWVHELGYRCPARAASGAARP
jgi:uncharacterized protein YkwD